MKECIQFWPQIVTLVLFLAFLLKTYLFAGTERKYQAKPFSSLLMFCFEVWIVIYGGFFASWHFPQYLYAILVSIVGILIFIFFGTLLFVDDKELEVKRRVPQVSWTDFILMGLLYWGGFFDGMIQTMFK